VSDPNEASAYARHAPVQGGPVAAVACFGPADEDAYRRGFQQGAFAVLEMLQEDVSPRRSDSWWAAVYDWRFNCSHKERTRPPDWRDYYNKR
jgi:hypothetical protein